MTLQITTRHADVLHDPVGAAMGWVLVLFDEKRARLFEAAPEGIVEWDAVVARDSPANSEHHSKGIGTRYGANAQRVGAGSHVEGHRAELLREHARTVAALTTAHLRRHPDARIFIAGPVKDRSAFIDALPRSAAGALAKHLSIPMLATLPEVAARFRSECLVFADASGRLRA